MAKKKHKPASNTPALNDKSYLSSGRARKLPVYKCEINPDWEMGGMAQVLVYRQHVNGHFTVGFYLVDLFCAGVKDTFYYFNEPQSIIAAALSNAPFKRETISYELAHNIIYGAVAYAEDLGIAPDPAFKLTSQILEEDTEDVPLIDIPFGRNGKPVLILNPTDPRNDYYKRQLAKTLAPDEYDIESLFGINGNLADDEDYDDMEDFYEEPALWNEADWYEFIEDTPAEELQDFESVALYMYRKLTPIPPTAALVVEAITRSPEFSVSDDTIPNEYYPITATEQAEINRLEEKLENLINQFDPKILEKLINLTQTIDEPETAENEADMTEEPVDPEQLQLQNALIAELNERIDRWPHNPVFPDQLIQLYQYANLTAQADELVLKYYQNFPDYLPAKICYANYLLKNNQDDQVLAVFDHQYSLSSLYPDQHTFSVVDLVSFYSLMARYFLLKEDLFLANYYLNLLEKFDIIDDLSVDMLTIIAIKEQTTTLMIPVLEKAQEDETYHRELINLLMS